MRSRLEQIWKSQRKLNKSSNEPGKAHITYNNTLPKGLTTDPVHVLTVLSIADRAIQAQVVNYLQRDYGNLHVQRVINILATNNNSSPVIQRQQPKKPKAVSPAATTIGPPRTSTYAIKGKSLAAVATDYASRDEAGSVEWRPHLSYQTSPTDKIISATVTVPLDVNLPVWNAPAGIGPKSKAEWNRARNALKAHEDSHIKLVRKHFDGFAKKLIGKTSEEAQTLFDETSAKLQGESDKYDTETDHGRNTGTVIDTSIEEKESADAAKKDIQKK